MSDSSLSCPQCQAPIPADAPGGLCPACLLAREQAEFEKQQIRELNAAFPQYELIELLGRGGMGEVYKARHLRLNRMVALKILPPPFGKEDEMTARFLREAQALASLSHPNIVTVHDFGESEGLCYFAMEYIDGTDLRRVIDSRSLSPDEALAIVPQICDALQYAHEEGIVHRDIKPGNILLDKKGRVKIADFGLAKIVGPQIGKEALTMTGQVVGTPFYMAPEQREHPLEVDHRADIYSLGVVFYEMLTGEIPVGRFQPPSEKVQVDVRVDEVVLRSLEREPGRRYQHVSEVKSGVAHAVQSSAVPPGAVPPPMPSAYAAGVPMPAPISKSPRAPRMSKTAIVGAIWAVFGLIAVVSLAVPAYVSTHSVPPPVLPLPPMPPGYPDPGTKGAVTESMPVPTSVEARPTWGIIMVLLSPVLLIGIAAPFGTTILGGIAVAQIRRSEGQIYGLPLAAADLLAFPLLLLTMLLMAVAGVVFQSMMAPGIGISPLPCLLAALAGTSVVAWWAWRKISAPVPA